MKRKLKNLVVADWMLELRPVNSFVVSRYRQAMRQGEEFPAIIVDSASMEIISGNHRYMSYLGEFGEDHAIEVESHPFGNHAEKLAFAVGENVKHGEAMDGITRRRFACAMIDEGMTTQEVAALMNVAVHAIEKWGNQTVLVIGNGAKPVKTGFDTKTVTKIKKTDYEEHMDKDLGVEARGLMRQLSRWLGHGWIDLEDERNKEAFEELKKAME